MRPETLPTNGAPETHIRFKTEKEALACREGLIHFIWPDGMPGDRRPDATEEVTEGALGGWLEMIDASQVRRVDRLEVSVFGLRSWILLIHPVEPAAESRLAVVHAGHSGYAVMKESYRACIDLFLKKGYTVAMVQMPMHGWNTDNHALLPNGNEVTIKAKDGHDAIVNLPYLDDTLAEGAGLRPLLEPALACINHWTHSCGGATNICMIGLSGGGWATHMLAAMDPRIQVSFPVAGAYPLYLRQPDPASVGDLEQYLPAIYDERIAADGTGGGIATWLEIFALGGYGAGRRQIMITSQFDSSCFRGEPAETVDTFETVVSDAVRTLGQGQWEHRLDSSHRGHVISPWALEQVVSPNL